MKKFKWVFMPAMLVFAFPGLAWTYSYETALADFNAGRFDQAVVEGRRLETSAGFTLALRAELVLIQYLYQPETRMTAIERAVKDGEHALLLDPDNSEAKLNLGIIVGLRGKFKRSISDGKRSRELIEAALEAMPDNDWALGAMAGWNAEIIFQAGRIPGRLIFGARRERALQLFQEALEKGPDNLTIRAAYIRALLKLYPEAMKRDIDEQMALILNATPANALEQIMQRQMKVIKAAMEAGDEEKLALYLDEQMALELD